MIKSADENYLSNHYEPIYSQFGGIAPLEQKLVIIDNESKVTKLDVGSQNISREIIMDLPTTDYNLHVGDSPSSLKREDEKTNEKLTLLGDSINSTMYLSPEKNNSTLSASAHDMSPILESGFTKCWKDSKIVASTPANPHTATASLMNTEMLSVLDLLCSPVTKKQDLNCGSSVKRLFDTTTEDTLHCNTKRRKREATSECLAEDTLHCNTERRKCEATSECSAKDTLHCNTKRRKCVATSECSPENHSIIEPHDPFKDHDISERTLIAICEGTNHLVESVHQEQSKFESSIIYDSNVKDSEEFIDNKISLNDLLKTVKILEYANKTTHQYKVKEKCKKQSKISNISEHLGFVRVEPGTSTDLSDTAFKKEHTFGQSPLLKEQDLDKLSANDTIGITDTQFCEVVDAAEILSSLNNSAIDLDYYKNCHGICGGNFCVENKESCALRTNKDLNTMKSSFNTSCENREFKGSATNFPEVTGTCDDNTISNNMISKSCNFKNKITENNLMDKLEENGASKIPSIAFQTASGNSVSVTDSALKIAKKMLYQDSYSVDNASKKLESSKFEGFNTASGKSVSVSKESLTKARQLFSEDTDSLETSLPEVSTDDLSNVIDKLEEKDGSKMGFQTASGKSVCVSKESLTKARQLFSQDTGSLETILPEVSTDDLNNVIINKLEEKDCSKMGFKTASGKSVSVSDSSLQIAKKMLYQDSYPVDSVSNILESSHTRDMDIAKNYFKKPEEILDSDVQSKNVKLTTFKGFNTASGKSVCVSKDSITKARQLFSQDTDSLETILPEVPTDDFNNVIDKLEEKDGSKMGFKTASGKSVSVSDSSLQIAKKLLCQDNYPVDIASNIRVESSYIRDMDIATNYFKKPEEILDSDVQSQNVKLTQFKGFNTASGKSVSVSKESLTKARQLFSYDTDGLNNVIYKLDEKDGSKMGFQTASGKSVSVSDSALQIAKNIYHLDSYPVKALNMLESCHVSEDKICLKKSDEIMDNDFKIHQLKSSTSVKSTKFEGFNTASGKSVSVSEESLYKARRLFLQDTNSQETILPEVAVITANNEMDQLVGNDVSKIPGVGFQTASSKSVSVSDSSLQIVKEKLYQNSNPIENASFIGKPTGIQKMDIVENGDSKSKDILNKGSQYHKMKTSTFDGFNTASGKSVSVSVDSLTKAKQMFLNDTHYDKTPDIEVQKTVETSLINYTSDGLLLSKDITSEQMGDSTINKQGKAYENNNVQFLQYPPKKSCSLFDGSPIFKADNCYANDEQKIVDEQSSNCKSKSFSEKFQPNSMPNNASQFEREPVKLEGSDYIKRQTGHSSEADLTEQSMSVLKSTCSHAKNSVSFKNQKSNTIQKIANSQKFYNSISQEGCIPFNFPSSVISEEDLSLLNQSLYHNLKHMNSPVGSRSSFPHFLSTSIDREVSESMAALVADEESNSPFSKQLILKPIVTSPAIMFDRSVRVPPISCDDNEMQFTNELSPVLDSNSYLKPSKLIKKNLFNQDNKMQAPNLFNSSDFKPPNATSTPKGELKKTKHSLEIEDVAPVCKRMKIEPDIQAQANNKAISEFVKEARKKAAQMQEKHAQGKSKTSCNIKPFKGLYLLTKQNGKGRTLKSLTGGHPLRKKSLEHLLSLGVSLAVVEMTAGSAKDFKFSASNYFSDQTACSNVDGITIGDDALLVLSPDGSAGVTEFTRAFQASPAVDPNMAQSSWISNHYRWIVLKLASMERTFPETLAKRSLTPNNVMLQLKYRYDRELDLCERPILRKILEKDETPARTMVLFVADIIAVQNKDCGERKELELSDGWYSVMTTIDSEMENLIRRKKVGIGTKLVVCGAELVGNEDGCNPLETPADVRLKVSTNSCRRVRWHTRLGLLPVSLPPLELRTVLPRGGAIQQLAALVARVYPLLFREKQPDGRSVVRSERAEQSAEDTYQLRRQQCAETILSELRREIEKSSSTSHKSLIGTDEDISLLKESMNSEEIQWIQEKNLKEASKIQEKMQDQLVKKLDERVPQRNVTRMLKVRLVSNSEDWCEQGRSALLTVWNPSEEVLSMLAEGNSLVFHHLSSSGYSRFGDMQLTGGRSTRYSVTSRSGVNRTTTSLSSLRDSAFAPPFSEVDLVGLVIQVRDTSVTDNKSVYIADADYNFLCISFSTEIKETGYKNALSPGNLVAITCLHWRSHLVSWSLPNAFASEMTSFTQNPRLPHLQKSLAKLRQLTRALDLKCYMEDCSGRIESLIRQRNSGGTTFSSCKPQNSSGINSRLGDYQDTSKSNVSDDSRTLCDSYGPNTSLTPKNKRMLLLERYGEPPPISPLLTSTPRRVKQNFRPPTRKSPSENAPR